MVPESNNNVRQRLKASRMGRESVVRKKEGVDRTRNHQVPKKERGP